jgi:hypothetical protein
MTNWSHSSAIAGSLVWLLLFAIPLSADATTAGIERLLLLAVLVVTPLALPLAGPADRAGRKALPYWAAVRGQPFAAALVVICFLLPAGVLAGLLAAGWLLVTGCVAAYGLVRLLSRGNLRADELCIDAGLLYLPVGAVWLLSARLGLNPLGFDDTIVILTAVHFHYAGFAAPLLAGLAGRLIAATRPAAWGLFRPVAGGVIAGIALVAMGITLARFTPVLEAFAAVAFAASLLGLVALVLFVVIPATADRTVQVLLAASSVSLVVTMVLAGGYAIGRFVKTPIVGIPQMVQIHGWLNALGFVLCGLLAWTLRTRQEVHSTLEIRD